MGTANTGFMWLWAGDSNLSKTASTHTSDAAADLTLQVWRDVLWAVHFDADPYKYDGPEQLDDMYYFNQVSEISFTFIFKMWMHVYLSADNV